jgi:hypothetical protein
MQPQFLVLVHDPPQPIIQLALATAYSKRSPTPFTRQVVPSSPPCRNLGCGGGRGIRPRPEVEKHDQYPPPSVARTVRSNKQELLAAEKKDKLDSLFRSTAGMHNTKKYVRIVTVSCDCPKEIRTTVLGGIILLL